MSSPRLEWLWCKAVGMREDGGMAHLVLGDPETVEKVGLPQIPIFSISSKVSTSEVRS